MTKSFIGLVLLLVASHAAIANGNLPMSSIERFEIGSFYQSCITGLGETVPDSEIGCTICKANPEGAAWRWNVLCARGKFWHLSNCSVAGPSSCPIKDIEVCYIYNGKYIPVGKKACVATGKDASKVYYEYGECVSKNNYQSLLDNIDENDPRCKILKIDPF